MSILKYFKLVLKTLDELLKELPDPNGTLSKTVPPSAIKMKFQKRLKECRWAFGVTCWEIFSLGLQPYPSVSPYEMSDYVKSGRVLNKPTLCSDEMYGIFRSCWNFQPEDRPCFAELVQDISQQLQLMKQQKPPPPLLSNPSTAYLKVH